MTNAFSAGYVSQLAPIKAKPTGRRSVNAFDGDDHKARQAHTHLPNINKASREDKIRRDSSFANGAAQLQKRNPPTA